MNTLIEVTGVTKAFGDNQVLKGVDFAADEGTVTALLGPSGSGKTTLLRTLNVLETPDTGVVRIGEASVDFSTPAGKSERKSAVTALRTQSGMVFQGHNLFPNMTVLQNIIEGPVQVQKTPRADAVRDAEQLLQKVGLGDRGDARPAQLSGGQQQRVGIARALALHPKVVLLDEPTSALDPELVGEVLTVIKDLAQEGWTMVIVTHEVRFAQQVADQVLFLDDGVIAERGDASVLTDPKHARTQQFLQRLLNPA